MTKDSMGQIRYEELAESVRNVFWLSKGLVYDSISSQIGWYAQLLAVYEIFGFSLFAAKWVRLLLALFALLSVSYLALKYIGYKFGWLPVVAFGISPTFLFFNTLQSEYGLDLVYLPIALFVLDQVDFKKQQYLFFWTFVLFALVMLFALSYPVFLFYIPGIVAVFGYKLVKQEKLTKLTELIKYKYIVVPAIAFSTPLILMLLSIKNGGILIYDPLLHAGLFRGGGKLELSLSTFVASIKGLFVDLFISGQSYYFEVKHTDFADYYTLIPLISTLVILILIWSGERRLRPILLTITSVAVLNILISGFTSDSSMSPGIRRFTGVLASFYLLYGVVCWWIAKIDSGRTRMIGMKWAKWFVILTLFLLPLHHLVVYRQNLSAIKSLSIAAERQWFVVAGPPDKSLETFVQKVQHEDLRLACSDEKGIIHQCRYSEIYSAIAGSCQWNRLICHEVLGWDEKSDQFIPLSADLWENYYFEH